MLINFPLALHLKFTYYVPVFIIDATDDENDIIICFRYLSIRKKQRDMEIGERDKLKDIEDHKTRPARSFTHDN